MEAVCRGARDSKKHKFGSTIGIIPFIEKNKANKFCDIVIPTGLGIARNVLVVNTGDAVVAVGGGAGTLSEIAFALQLDKKIICCLGFGGWSEKMGTQEINKTGNALIRNAISLEEVIAMLK